MYNHFIFFARSKQTNKKQMCGVWRFFYPQESLNCLGALRVGMGCNMYCYHFVWPVQTSSHLLQWGGIPSCPALSRLPQLLPGSLQPWKAVDCWTPMYLFLCCYHIPRRNLDCDFSWSHHTAQILHQEQLGKEITQVSTQHIAGTPPPSH